jgi:hypothetical protein
MLHSPVNTKEQQTREPKSDPKDRVKAAETGLTRPGMDESTKRKKTRPMIHQAKMVWTIQRWLYHPSQANLDKR